MKDTICAISTPPGIGGVALIRVSGPRSKEIVSKILEEPSKHKFEHGRFFHAFIKDHQKNEIIEEAIISYFKSPNSFTGEDVVEISVHGGIYTPKLVLDLLIKNGARLAEPGEFTKRAFLNGKMDLIQVQAMIDLIKAKSELQVKFAMSKLQGELSKKLKTVQNLIFDILREVEARVEFEEDVPELDYVMLKNNVEKILNDLENFIIQGEKNSLIFEGVQVAITGKPNVGKSSLFNSLLKMERAIVTEIPGTTRDIIHEEFYLEGIPVRFYDTAGLRKTSEFVESIGIKRAEEIISNSHIKIFVLDASSPLTEEDFEAWQKLNGEVIVVLNKIDLGITADYMQLSGIEKFPLIRMSCITGEGLQELEDVIKSTVKKFVLPGSEISLSQRELHILKDTYNELREALDSINQKPLDIIAFHIQNSARKLDEIFGIGDIPERVLNEIFRSFCIGK
ncbi:MAG: tRNA uridine-5-carboxymethylaminomethyl(34) synthesis GTPase MnmE [candidate division WOR-3 bacterium]